MHFLGRLQFTLWLNVHKHHLKKTKPKESTVPLKEQKGKETQDGLYNINYMIMHIRSMEKTTSSRQRD